jgi:hypothetical protein
MKSQSIKEEPMDSFQKWLRSVPYGEEDSIMKLLIDGSYGKHSDILSLLEEAYDAGVDAGIDAAYEFL